MTVTYDDNPQQLKVMTMLSEFEHNAVTRAVEALEAIAEHMGVLATMALANSTEKASSPYKARGGRPRKEAPAPAPAPVAEPAEAAAPVAEPEAPVEAPQAAPVAPAAPTEEERREKFDALKSALKAALALHGEEETRRRLQFNKFSEVPFEAIDATIERLEA